ncbi:MAG: radical SAM protein [Candidatus Hadarchaeota archaeon]
MPEKVRVAFGTGAVLGLWDGRMEVKPTTAHLLTYHEGRCAANCKFCPQASESSADINMLSRVLWPPYQTEKVISSFGKNEDSFSRVCIQAVNCPNVADDIRRLVENVKKSCGLPISVSCQPMTRKEMEGLASLGVDRICVPLDAATPDVFKRVKGGYSWEKHMDTLNAARDVFGFRVTTHLIVGLGESEREMVQTIGMLDKLGVTTALFAFTPIKGTLLSESERPDIDSYRRIQLARYLMLKQLGKLEDMKFEGEKLVDFGVDETIIQNAVESGEPFMTSGCSGCNRPFYNESPRGPIFNYPRKPTKKEIEEIKSSLALG